MDLPGGARHTYTGRDATMKAELTVQYRDRLDRLARVLYDRDPYSRGVTVSAPDGEYSPVAARLMPLLSRARTVDECAQILAGNHIRDCGVGGGGLAYFFGWLID